MASLIVNTGRAMLALRAIAAALYVGWGTGAGTTGYTDTTLFTEASEARVSATLSQVTTTTTNDTAQLVATLTVAGSGKTITNVAAFDASTVGNVLGKADFTGLALNVGDSITFTLKIPISS